MNAAVKRRKHSDSTTRKKVRTESGRTEAPTIDTTKETLSTQEVPPLRPLVGTPVGTAAAPARPAMVAKPKNPHAGRVTELRGNFGTGYHDVGHFKATPEKANHGVWQGSLSQVRKWVRMALGSIYADDQFVVATKPGTNGSYRYLVSTDGSTVGYLSGFSVPSGGQPQAQHIEVFLNSKGDIVTAFPSSPEIF
jgi:hypothetical protein